MGSPAALDDLFQLAEGFRVLGAWRRIVTPGIGSLQRPDHRASDGDGCAAMVGLAHQVPLRARCDVTGKAIAAESVDHFGEAPLADLRAVLGHVELEELPITRRRVEAPVSLDHGLARDELDDRARWIDRARRGVRGSDRRAEVPA